MQTKQLELFQSLIMSTTETDLMRAKMFWKKSRKVKIFIKVF